MSRVRRHPDDTPIVDKILIAALREFGTSGYERASMKAIASRAGVTPGALYYHYKDKRELLFKGLESVALAVFEACVVSPDQIDADPRAALVRFVRAYVEYQLSHIRKQAPMYSSLVHGTRNQLNVLTPTQLKVLRSIELNSLAMLKSILQAGVQQGQFRAAVSTVTAFAILGMCEHTLTWVNPNGRLNVIDLGVKFAEYALRLVELTPIALEVGKPTVRKARPLLSGTAKR